MNLCSVAQLCPILCDPMDYSLPGSSVHGIFQTRILDWVAFPSPGDLPNLGIKPYLLHWQVDSLLLSYLENHTLLILCTK